MPKRYSRRNGKGYRLMSAGATGFVPARGVASRDGAVKAPIGQSLQHLT